MPNSNADRLPTELFGWRHFPHGADIGICGFGPSLAWSFEQAGLALTAVITDAPIALDDYALVRCRAPDTEDLFVAWLNALTYEMAVRRMLFGAFKVCFGYGGLCGAAYGQPVDIKRHAPACEVKGATYTELRVKHQANGLWAAQCVIDV